MNKFIFFIGVIAFSNSAFAQKKKTYCTVVFETIVNGKKIVLNDSNYTNAFNENYTVSKLKYYVSNIRFIDAGKNYLKKTVYLIDASKNNTLYIQRYSTKIKGISFLLGVDSALNCSGAQSGALDPLNDMFWTWNNGYIMFKLEGKSGSSKADNNRIEHHIGGYKGANKTMRKVFLPITENYFNKNNTITIQLNIDNYWKGIHELHIAETPVISAPGEKAAKSADNFDGMFLIKK
ncbi:MAG: hypothetical protein LH615_10700 [Ferruginibacter sp.]|nr:hypothetical protein [Ferruginibacter sp.]